MKLKESSKLIKTISLSILFSLYINCFSTANEPVDIWKKQENIDKELKERLIKSGGSYIEVTSSRILRIIGLRKGE